MKDLACLVADKHTEVGLSTLLGRPEALGIRHITYELFIHPRRDPGCFHESHDFLRALHGRYSHGLVLFDRAWEGGMQESASELEDSVRGQLRKSGLSPWADVVVIDPELEVWVWSDSPHVDEQLGWKDRTPTLRSWLRLEGLWPEGSPKPPESKAAVERALWMVRIPRSSSIYRNLARLVSVERCQDPAFHRLLGQLRAWFSEGG